MQQQQPDEIGSDQIQKAILMEAMVQTDMGVSFLQWLCRRCGWNRSIISNEQSAQRDIWLEFRRHIPVEKLALIEYLELRDQQQLVRELLEVISKDDSEE